MTGAGALFDGCGRGKDMLYFRQRYALNHNSQVVK
jgi:hypothetical protein